MKTKKTSEEKNKAQTKWLRLFLTLIVFILLIIICYITLKNTHLWDKINSIEKLKQIVEDGGIYSSIVFIVLQILQTTILQIPAIIITIAGTLIFGRWQAFVLSYIAVILGSVIMFWIGRKAGRKFLNWLVGKDSVNRWVDKMSHGKYLYFLMMLLPMFPDDILCLVAGFTNMSFKYFIITNLITRAVGISCTVFFGSGTIIPFNGWGLIVWGIIALFIAILFYLSIRYQDKIDETLMQFSNKKKVYSLKNF